MLIGPTLARYLALRFAKAIFAVFATVFALVFVLDFIELLRRAGDMQGATTGFLARLSLYRAPKVAEQVLPFAVLFGAMGALLNLSRKLELVVARAAGVSVWQFLAPPVGVAALIGLFTVGIYNPAAARLKEQADALETAVMSRTKAAPLSGDLWLRQRSLDGGAILRADKASAASGVLTRVTVFNFEPNGAFMERIDAKQARLEDGYWELDDARVIVPGEPPQTFGRYLLATNLTAEQVRETFATPEAVPFWDLPETVERTERAGLDATRYRLQFQSLTARPLLFIAMVLVAATVSLRFFRFGGVARMVMAGVAAGFVLYVATQLVERLGTAGLLSAATAAWSPAIVGSLLGTLALLYQEDG